MSNKEFILNNIKKNLPEPWEKIPAKIKGIQYMDKREQFIKITEAVGGKVEVLGDRNLKELIDTIFPDAVNIVSNVDSFSQDFINPDDYERPHDLQKVDLAIVKGEFGVAENGAIWIPQNVYHRAVYFISEYIVILLDQNSIVNNMHEAYEELKPAEGGYGVFVSGPSKTADIEQALVVGAHGPKGAVVILVPPGYFQNKGLHTDVL